MSIARIAHCKGREILDSRGNPTVEATVTLRIYEIIQLAICLITLGLKLYRQAKNLKKVGH